MDETEDREALMNSASTATIAPPVDSDEESGFSWWKLLTGQLLTKSIARDEAERAAEVTEDGDQGAVDPDVLEHEDGAGQAGPDVPGSDLDLSDLGPADSVVDQPDTAVALDTAGPAVALMEVDEPAVDGSSLEEGQEGPGGQALADDSVAADPSFDLGIDDSPASAEAVSDELGLDALETDPSEPTAEITDAVTDAVVEPPEPEVTEPADHLARPPADPHDEMTERWVDELRSGRHQQLCGAWEDTGFFGGHTECTLQVAKNTFNVDLGVLTDKYGQPFISEILRRNDHEQQSFKQIADYIEKTQLKERRRELEMER
jgi:hypothetical protein